MSKLEPFRLLPCKPGVCQECAVDHPFDQPHNAQSIYYQYRFYGQHGRWPAWKEACEHCSPEIQVVTKTVIERLGHKWEHKHDPAP